MKKNFIDRRQFLIQAGTYAAALSFARPALARDAREYGVLPNRREDQSRAFQKMIDRAAKQRVKVYLPNGTYAISGVQLPDFVDLAGDGDHVTLVNTTRNPLLNSRGGSTALLEDILIDGVHLGGQDSNSALIDLRQVTRVELKGITIRRARYDALRLERCSGSITQCNISDSGRFGLYAIESKALNISHNTVEDCADGGIIIHRYEQGYDGSRVRNNTVRRISAVRGGTGQWGNGINIFKTDDVEITDNTIEDCAFSAMRANTARNFKMNNNTCLRSGEMAIFAEFGFRNAEIKDNIVIGAASGISATNANVGGGGAIITGNIVKDMNAIGPYKPQAPYFGQGISAEADALVAQNTIENTAGYGINLGWGPYLRNVDVVGNTIKNAKIGIGISAAKGAGPVSIKGNQINAREGNIRTHEWDKISTIDIGLKPDQAPNHITLEANIIG